MIRVSLKISVLILIFICSWGGICEVRVCEGEEKMNSVWEPFREWFEWKKNTDLPKEQREVVDYFDAAGKIKEQAKDYRVNYMSPEESVSVMKMRIKDLKALTRPEICDAYYDALMKELQISLEYQEARKIRLSNEQLQKINLKLVSVDGLQFTTFFQALKDVGLFDKMEEERAKGLDLKTPKKPDESFTKAVTEEK